MIKAVTYQGASNFASNLYALEIRSRFADQSQANGYYLGYGQEIAAKVIGNSIVLQSGAFVVQGRMNEIVGEESVEVDVTSDKVGIVCARIETFHPSDANNCKLVVYTANNIDSISCVQEDTYAADAERTNKVYELPIYKFEIRGGVIDNLEKVIMPVEDFQKTYQLVNGANTNAATALEKANTAIALSDEMRQLCDRADSLLEKLQKSALLNENILDRLFPIGYIYISMDSTPPDNLFGGEWQKIEGKFLFATQNEVAGTLGGRESVTLGVENLPPHNHGIDRMTVHFRFAVGYAWNGYMQGSDWGINVYREKIGGGVNPSNNGNTGTWGVDARQDLSPIIYNTGSGQAFNILPPYITVHMWQRIH